MGISLYKELKSGSWQASVIASYGTYFPLYESVVLPRLVGCGCRTNLMILDAGECSSAFFAAPPLLAGRSYSLIPVTGARAFHPKIILLLSRNRAKLFVGSHNLTFSGFGLNSEVTNKIEAQRTSAATERQAVRTAWNFLKSWTGEFPAELQRPIQVIEELISGVCGNVQGAKPLLFAATPTGPALWDQVLPEVQKLGGIRAAVAIGPYFDAELEFLSRLEADLRPGSLTIGVDPDSIQLSAHTRSKTAGKHFVDIRPVKRCEGLLHAKALLFESGEGEVCLISGSANPSSPAWLAGRGERNAECVVLRHMDPSQAIGDPFVQDLMALKQLSALSRADWDAIGFRSQVPHDRGQPVILVHAFPREGGYLLDRLVEEPLEKLELVTVDRKREQVHAQVLNEEERTALVIDNVPVSDSVIALELSLSSRKALAIVHYPSKLAALSHTSAQNSVREALEILDNETPDFEKLFRIVSRVIFDDTAQEPVSPGKQSKETTKAESEDRVITSFVAEEAEEKARRQSRLRYHENDLLYLVDALIRKLRSEDLTAGVELSEPSEEELIGTEEDLKEKRREPVDPKDLDRKLQAATSKVKTLVSRMVKRLEGIDDENRAAVVLEYASVLGVLSAIRRKELDPDWVAPGRSILPQEQLHRLWGSAAEAIFSRIRGVKELGPWLQDEAHQAIEQVISWSLWAAWESKLDSRELGRLKKVGFNPDPIPKFDNSFVRELLRLQSFFAVLAAESKADEDYQSALLRSLPKSEHPAAADWTGYHLRWGSGIQEVFDHPESSCFSGESPRTADLVAVTPPSGDRPHVHFASDCRTPDRVEVLFNEKGRVTSRKFSRKFVRALVVSLQPSAAEGVDGF